MASTPVSDILTPAEAAERLRVHTRTVQRWAREGLLPSMTTLGGRRRFRRSDVEAAWRRMYGPEEAV